MADSSNILPYTPPTHDHYPDRFTRPVPPPTLYPRTQPNDQPSTPLIHNGYRMLRSVATHLAYALGAASSALTMTTIHLAAARDRLVRTLAHLHRTATYILEQRANISRAAPHAAPTSPLHASARAMIAEAECNIVRAQPPGADVAATVTRVSALQARAGARLERATWLAGSLAGEPFAGFQRARGGMEAAVRHGTEWIAAAPTEEMMDAVYETEGLFRARLQGAVEVQVAEDRALMDEVEACLGAREMRVEGAVAGGRYSAG